GDEPVLALQPVPRIVPVVEVRLEEHRAAVDREPEDAVVGAAHEGLEPHLPAQTELRDQAGRHSPQRLGVQRDVDPAPSTTTPISFHDAARWRPFGATWSRLGSNRIRWIRAGKYGSNRNSGRSSTKCVQPVRRMRSSYACVVAS